MARHDLPVLWQLELSHYNEKVRWALDHKRIPHVRRALLPGVHAVTARRLTGGACDATAMDRLERELGSSGYLVGDRFTVADLAAASLFYPIVTPPSFPYPSVTEVPASAQEFLDSPAGRPGGRWAARIYERHRAVR